MTTEHQPVAGEPPIHRARYSLAIHEGARDDCRLCDIHDAGSQAPAPLGVLAGREQRRRATANILARIDRSKRILEDEATLLRTLVTAEQADGDQACEQRDQAAASLTDLRNDLYAERRAHEEHRRSLAVLQGLHPDADWLNVTAAVTSVLSARDRDRRFLTEARRLRNEACALLDSHQLAMSKALGLGTSAPWDAIAERAQAAQRGEAESVRAREAAERRATESRTYAERADREGERLAELLGQAEARVRAVERSAADARIRSGHSIAEARRNRDAWRNARKRAREVSADYAGIVARRAEAEASRDRWKAAAFEQQERASAAEQRAERAETTLTAIRTYLAGQRATMPQGYPVAVPADDVEAALGDPQPATVSEADDTAPASPVYNLVSYIIERQWADAARTTDEIHADIEPLLAVIRAESAADPCAHGCRQAADDLTRLGQEIDAEPRGGITDHTYEAADGLCGADFLGHICGAARDDHDLIEPEQPAEPLMGSAAITDGAGTIFTLPGGVKPAVTWAPRPCGEALWGSHGGHRYMLGGKGYQCPGGDVREQPAEPLLRGTAPLVLSLDIAPAEIAALLSKVRRAARAMRKAGLL